MFGRRRNRGKVVEEPSFLVGILDEDSGVSLRRSYLPESTLINDEEILRHGGETYTLRQFKLRGYLDGIIVRNGTPKEDATAIAVRNRHERFDLLDRLKENPGIIHRITADPRNHGRTVTLYSLMGNDPDLFNLLGAMTVYCKKGLLEFESPEGFVAYNGNIYDAVNGTRIATVTQPNADKVLADFGMRVLARPEYETLRQQWKQQRAA